MQDSIVGGGSGKLSLEQKIDDKRDTVEKLTRELERLAPYTYGNPDYNDPDKRERYYIVKANLDVERQNLNELLNQKAEARRTVSPHGQTFSPKHHEVVKTVYGFNVYRPKGTNRDYRVDTGVNRWRAFKTQKAAEAYIKAEMQKDRPQLFNADPGREITSSTYKRARKRTAKQMNDLFKGR